MANPQFIDLTHHLSPEALARKVNPMKELVRIVLENPQLISLANGDPHPSLCPIRSVEFQVASTATADPVSEWRTLGAAAPTQSLSTTSTSTTETQFRASMGYGHGAGQCAALDAVAAITAQYHNAPHHVPTMTLASADAITKVFRLLGTHGDFFLADEFTFGPMPLAADAHGINWVPVRIDSGGLIPEDLERILREWDDKRGRRPHVLYTTPCGQNPTGSTLSLERRKRIYEIAQKYDIIIIEDDPYYFLQYDTPGSEPSSSEKPFPVSFLSLDTEGRVIRIDSFSKIMAPGLRLGWIISSPAFHSELVKFIDLSTQHPSGLPQTLIAQLLAPGEGGGWAVDGFDRWVRSLRREFQRRRDLLLDLFAREVAPTGLASVDVPESGMFLWVRVHLEQHPRFKRAPALNGNEHAVNGNGHAANGNGHAVNGNGYAVNGKTDAAAAKPPKPHPAPQTNCAALMRELFETMYKAGLLTCPATYFVLNADSDFGADGEVHIDDRSNFIRITFAGSEEAMQQGLPLFGRVLKEFFAA